MKDHYPEYNKGIICTADIEKRLSPEDKQILEDFLKICSTNASEQRVNTKIKTYILQMYDIIEKPFSEWDFKGIREVTILLNASEKAEWTKNDIKKILRRFLRHLFKRKPELDDMLELIKCKSDSEAFNHSRINENTLIDEHELEKILKRCSTYKQKAILALLFEGALRPQELRFLRWSDVKIDFEVGSVTVFSNKTRKSRTIPIKDSVYHLRQWKQNFEFTDVKGEDYIFPNPRDRTKPLSNNALPVMFKRLSQKAGIDKNIFPYLLRHSRLTKVSQELPAHLESKFAGHSIKQSQMYVHLSSDDVRRAMVEKVFKVKDISPENKHKLEQDIEEIRRQNAYLLRSIEILSEIVHRNEKEHDIRSIVKMKKSE